MTILGWVLLSLVVPLVLNEVGELSPWIARRLSRLCACLIPDVRTAMQYAEEWPAGLEDVPGKLTRLFAALSLAVQVVPRAWVNHLRAQPSRRQADRLIDARMVHALKDCQGASSYAVGGHFYLWTHALYNDINNFDVDCGSEQVADQMYDRLKRQIQVTTARELHGEPRQTMPFLFPLSRLQSRLLITPKMRDHLLSTHDTVNLADDGLTVSVRGGETTCRLSRAARSELR